MIGFIKGTVDTIGNGFCIIDTNGIGYRIFMSSNDLSKIETKQTIKIITYLSVREDALLLYGFLEAKTHELFINLISVSGVGAKVALGILSSINPDSFCIAVKNKNIKELVKLPGIGKKTAERLILELKDKLVAPETMDEAVDNINIIETSSNNNIEEAKEALISLGYTSYEILKAFRNIENINNSTTENIIKESFKLLVRRT
jgi:Holliday junction DNA helicase RuvA